MTSSAVRGEAVASSRMLGASVSAGATAPAAHEFSWGRLYCTPSCEEDPTTPDRCAYPRFAKCRNLRWFGGSQLVDGLIPADAATPFSGEVTASPITSVAAIPPAPICLLPLAGELSAPASRARMMHEIGVVPAQIDYQR